MNRIQTFATIIFVMILLTACGSDSQTEPTPEATDVPPTPTEDQLTMRDLVAMSYESFPEITFMRTTSQSGQMPKDGEAPAFTGAVQDWTPNGDRYLAEFQDGSVVNEFYWVDGVVYMKGVFVSSAVAPELDVNTWVILDTEVVPENTPVGERIRYLTRPLDNPYGDLTEETLNEVVTENGTVTINDRTCTLYTFGDEENTGTEIRYEIVIDERGLPCQIIERAGDFQNSTVYVFDIESEIEAPLEGTPVSGTPEG